MPEIELEDILAGISICRNPDLANIFYRLQLIEAYGTGISKIMKAYEGTNTRPRIETTKNTFKIILPNVNTNSGSTITSIPAKEEAPVFILNDNPALSSQEKRILEYARNYNQITKNNAASLLEVSASTATRLINGLLKQNLLVRHEKQGTLIIQQSSKPHFHFNFSKNSSGTLPEPSDLHIFRNLPIDSLPDCREILPVSGVLLDGENFLSIGFQAGENCFPAAETFEEVHGAEVGHGLIHEHETLTLLRSAVFSRVDDEGIA